MPESVGLSVRDVVEDCRNYAKFGDGHLLRKTTGQPPCPESMSWRFEEAFEKVVPNHVDGTNNPSLHECRSLAAREYEREGLKVQGLLGHSKASMTELYLAGRGIDEREGRWKTVEMPS